MRSTAPTRARPRPALAAACAAVVTLFSGGPPEPAGAQPIPAGATAAVLSFIDAAAGRVEVVRHWPWAPTDADVYPFIPYAWSGCPGPGAIMMLVTTPVGAPLLDRITQEVQRRLLGSSAGASGSEIARVAAALRTPGDPAAEALKAAAPLISDLFTYERRGYAVFLFLRWNGIGCGIILRSVPEGYAIPFVE